MKYGINDTVNGFKVKNVREVKELSGVLTEFEHTATGAELCWFNNGDANKLFSIAFKTLPEDDTGVFHILEHSVLCGSDEFPVKEPFVELLKGSMNTFLNAMTFQDKTVYPISSRNEQDFLNLTKVYLDAVFRPAILHKPEIFCQEGWHIEEDGGDGPEYRGVVFNEMKGALSSGEDMAQEKLLTLLYGRSPYGVNSGGDPAHIPELTYEKFVGTYKKYYHPGNSLIWLDGDVPLEKALGLIDSYLSGYGRSPRIADAPHVGRTAVSAAVKYDVDKAESLENKGMLVFGKIIGTWKDRIRSMAGSVLSGVLLGTNDDPLKRAVLSSGLAQDIYCYVDDSVQQPYLAVICTNVKDGCEEELRQLIADTAEQIASDGIPASRLEAAISRYEFRSREQEEPQGLIRNIVGLKSWLHGGDPLDYIVSDGCFAELRKMIGGNGFSELTREFFADRSGEAFLRVIPSHTAGDELREEEKKRLGAVRANWTEAQLEENRGLCARLKAWQETPDSPEALATIPALSLSEISPEPLVPPTEESSVGGVKVLFHKVPCHGLVHFSMYIDVSDFTDEELAALASAETYLGVLGTEDHSAAEIRELIEGTAGRMNFGLEVNGDHRDINDCRAYFSIKVSALSDRFGDAAELAREILLRTRFDEKDKLREIAVQNYEDSKMSFVRGGNYQGIYVSLAGFGERNALQEAVSGYSAVRFTGKLAEDFEGTYQQLTGAFMKLRGALNKKRLIMSVSSDVFPDISGFIGSIPEEGTAAVPAKRSCGLCAKTGIPVPAQIGFATSGWNLAEAGREYDGSMAVAANILSLEYLWSTVRVRGGAYGAGLRVSETGNICTYSYRDPSPAATRNVTAEAGTFLREFCGAAPNIDKYIISTVSGTEPLVSPRTTGNIADSHWFSGITAADLRNWRAGMLSADCGKLLEFAELLDRMAEGRRECIVAFRDALDPQEDLEILELN